MRLVWGDSYLQKARVCNIINKNSKNKKEMKKQKQINVFAAFGLCFLLVLCSMVAPVSALDEDAPQDIVLGQKDEDNVSGELAPDSDVVDDVDSDAAGQEDGSDGPAAEDDNNEAEPDSKAESVIGGDSGSESETPINSDAAAQASDSVVDEGFDVDADAAKTAMRKGQVYEGGHWFYFEQDTGEMAKSKFVTLTTAETNDGPKTVYYNENGYMLYGLQEIEGKTYFFNFHSGAEVVGQFQDSGYWYYFDAKKGELATSRFVNLTIEETNDGAKTVYYDANGRMLHGVHKIDGKYYYFHDMSGKLFTSDVVVGNRKYIIRDGELRGTILLNVPYYAQNDPRWGNRRYGLSTIGKTGCSVAVGTSLINYYADASVLPYDTAWLFNMWGDYNANGIYGTTSRVWRKVGSAYGIEFRNNLNLASITEHLRVGHMVKASVQGVPFMKGGGSHALLLMGLNENGQTYIYDPANSGNNGWYDVSRIWNQRSTSFEDLYDGGPFFAMWR